MKLMVAFALVGLLFVPSAAPKGIPGGEVIYAEWMVGGRFTREEWLERSTGATHRRDVGGPSCARHVVANSNWVLWYGCHSPIRFRVRGRSDSRLRDSSDLLLPRRMLGLGRAEIVGPIEVDGVSAVRVRIPYQYGTQYADLDPATRLPLRLVFQRNGAMFESVYNLSYRSKRRSSLPKDFFTPRR